jgi:hypothetical protein
MKKKRKSSSMSNILKIMRSSVLPCTPIISMTYRSKMGNGAHLYVKHKTAWDALRYHSSIAPSSKFLK